MLSSPFGNEPLEEIPLDRSPLERVIGQVVLPRLARLSPQGSDLDAIRDLIQHLSRDYPVLNEGHEISLRIDPSGVTQEKGPLIRSFQSADGHWTATVGEASIALDTTAYTSRADFLARLTGLIEVVGKALDIPTELQVARVGVRYVNRVSDWDLLKQAHLFVRSEGRGGFAVERPEHVQLVHAMSDSLYHLGNDRLLQARWGLLPGGFGNLPGVTGLPGPSWILDLDSYTQQPQLFEPANLTALIETMAATAYRYFRWLVTPEFITTFGGSQ